MLAHGAGLRVSEITGLQVADIDSKRMLIHVREGKTGPRHVMLSPRVLEALRAYWKAARPKGPSLFPGRSRSANPGLSREAVNRVLLGVARKAGIRKRVYPHMLRHYAESPVMPSCRPSHAGIAGISRGLLESSERRAAVSEGNADERALQ
jgi:integrase